MASRLPALTPFVPIGPVAQRAHRRQLHVPHQNLVATASPLSCT